MTSALRESGVDEGAACDLVRSLVRSINRDAFPGWAETVEGRRRLRQLVRQGLYELELAKDDQLHEQLVQIALRTVSEQAELGAPGSQVRST